MAGAIMRYQFSTDGETLTLTITRKYKKNQAKGDIEEKQTISLTKIK